MEQLIIQEELSGKRLDLVVSLLFPELTRAHAQKLIKEGAVSVNEKPRKPAYAVTAGELLAVELPEPEVLEVLPEDIPLDILYEDSDVILVNKPKGMVVHPAAGHASGTLVNALLYHCRDSLSGINGILRPGIVHRIDKDTTGVIIACKNDRAHQCIAAQLKEHSITRRYLALAQGVIREDEGTVDAPLGRDPENRKKMKSGLPGGKHAVTHFRVLERFSAASYLSCSLETGRTHQILALCA
ncbi:RluA family pseudouridine synthase [Stomatobaculum sp. F0698]|uniref:RluA family pseudouridine synthase n=1 Tax=Stomatobaculum sp. F0698 TaxID=3059030 RepID=UPI00272C1B08|nr:RluA family pseudouridine synthase [Stomatobaculum sp. F0698]WLD87582.1 RluA family pseudouridine synthase [Stomatobaculum sp. F0698]